MLEIAPTVQCLTGAVLKDTYNKPEFYDYIINAQRRQVITDTLQSEEGGRFYHEQNRSIIVEADESFPLSLPPRYTWMTLSQMYEFLQFNNYLNIQARSLLSLINYI